MQVHGCQVQTRALASQPPADSSAVIDLTGDSDEGELARVVETDSESDIEIIG